MSFFSKLFGGGKAEEPKPAPSAQPPGGADYFKNNIATVKASPSKPTLSREASYEEEHDRDDDYRDSSVSKANEHDLMKSVEKEKVRRAITVAVRESEAQNYVRAAQRVFEINSHELRVLHEYSRRIDVVARAKTDRKWDFNRRLARFALLRVR